MYEDRRDRRYRRRDRRDRPGGRSGLRGIAAGIFLIGMALSFAFGGFNLVIFFSALAVAAIITGLASGRPSGMYGSFMTFIWMLILALYFATHLWIWFLIGAGLSAILGPLYRPLAERLAASPFFSSMNNQSVYEQAQPPAQPQPPTSQTYEQGYQPPTEGSYQEGGKQYPYPASAEAQTEDQPQAQYPQQMPPQV